MEGDIMKQKEITLATLFFLLIISCLSSAYAAGPDGFANVSWGASQSQVEQEMARQGCKSKGQKSANDGSTVIMYYGTLAGTAGDLEFFLLNGTFYRGSFHFYYEDGGGAEFNAYSKFSSIIQSKYGSPTKSGSIDPQGSYSIWDGLMASGSPDSIKIMLLYTAESRRCGSNLCSSSFDVQYTNEGLQRRLAGGNKNGL
jgi:hypothetical protein